MAERMVAFWKDIVVNGMNVLLKSEEDEWN